MCELNAIMKKQGSEEPVMDGVSRVSKDERGRIVLESILGEQTIVSGVIEEIDTTTNRLIISPQ